MICTECAAYVIRDHMRGCAIARKPYQGGCLTEPRRIQQDLDHELQRLPEQVTASWIWSGRRPQEEQTHDT